MWIVHFTNGETVNGKNTEWLDVNQEGITSGQLLFNSTYYTISKTADDQRFIQQKMGASYFDIQRGKQFNRLKIKQELLCIYNSAGEAIGYKTNYLTGEAEIVECNVLDRGFNLEVYGIDLAEIASDKKPELSEYKMKV